MCYIGYVCCPILLNLCNKIFLNYEIILQCIIEYNLSYNDEIWDGLHHAPYQKTLCITRMNWFSLYRNCYNQFLDFLQFLKLRGLDGYDYCRPFKSPYEENFCIKI